MVVDGRTVEWMVLVYMLVYKFDQNFILILELFGWRMGTNCCLSGCRRSRYSVRPPLSEHTHILFVLLFTSLHEGFITDLFVILFLLCKMRYIQEGGGGGEEGERHPS